MFQELPNTASRLACTARKIWTAMVNGLRKTVIDDQPKPYRPELYYMRGPGPKWREKHAQCRHSAAR